MKKYYSEQVEKDTKTRADFLSGIDAFLKASKVKADNNRADFITPEKYKSAPEAYREKFIDMLGFPLREKREMPVVEKKFVARDYNVDIYRMTFTYPNGLNYYGIYFKQIDSAEEKPFLFGIHGGAGTPEIASSLYFNSANYNHLVRRLTDKGASVFAPQLLLWKIEDYGNPYDRLETDGRLRQLGGCITALEVYLMQCALDYFIEKENVNQNKLGVTGLSYGGMYALNFSAVDTRIKACYSCSYISDVFQWTKSDWSYQNAQNTFTVAETAGMIAPRPLVVAMGVDDAYYQLGTEEESKRIIPYYEIFDKKENFKYVAFKGIHELDKSDEELDFLFNALE